MVDTLYSALPNRPTLKRVQSHACTLLIPANVIEYVQGRDQHTGPYLEAGTYRIAFVVEDGAPECWHPAIYRHRRLPPPGRADRSWLPPTSHRLPRRPRSRCPGR